MLDSCQHYINIDDSIPISISREEYNKIRSIISEEKISKSLAVYKEMCELLSFTNIDNNSHVDSIVKILLKNKNIDNVINYLRTREQNGLTLKELINLGSFTEAFNIMGFDEEVIKKLFNLTFNGRSIMGKGEILINILVKNAIKPKQRGDILIDDIKYDIKIERARFRGQKGFNNSATVSNYLEKHLKCFSCTHEIPLGGTNSYHPTTTTAGIYFKITKELIEKGDMAEKDAINGYKNALLQAYNKINVQYLTFIDEFYKNYNEQVIIKGLPLALTKYYLDIEQLNEGGVICLSASGKIRLLNHDNLHSFDLRSPSFSNSASNQGSAAMLYSI